MKFAMCNEFCDGWPLEDALKLARDTGYHGVEVAPYTLADDVRDIPMSRRDALRSTAETAGVQIIGLHWLLVKPVGLYVNGPDAALRKKLLGSRQADPIDVCQSNFNSFVTRQIDAGNTCHKTSTSFS